MFLFGLKCMSVTSVSVPASVKNNPTFREGGELRNVEVINVKCTYF